MISELDLAYDGITNAGDTGFIAETANPYTLRASTLGVQGLFVVGFFDTLAHALAAIAAAQAATQFGNSATPATIATWMGTTSPQTGFIVYPRAYTYGGSIPDEYQL